MAIVKSKYRLITQKEREEEEKKQKAGGFVLPTYEELAAIEEKAKEDAARVASSEKKIELFQKPSNWDDGYQFGDVTKSILGTVGDVGVGAVKGVMKLGEGIGDALQYGAAAVTDLFGADETAERIRQNAQREKVAEAFSGVDEKLDKYSVLGRSSDAAAESLGQIGGIIATGGIAGALGAGAVGTTAATTGVMGLSSFGSGTGEAYAAGAEEGEAEAYGAIAGVADALSEMIFGGLGKGFKALGLSKGITSADDALAKAVTSKIRSTLAKNTVQLGIKAGAEGIEEVLAGTMQAAGKKLTYMSEQDFADIIRDENLLEQFVVGAFASGVAQAPSFVRANRAGVDLVSDDADNGNAYLDNKTDGQNTAETDTEGAGQSGRVWEDNDPEHAEIERTGRESGAADDDIRMAGDLSSALGKRIRFYREEAQGGMIRNGEYHEDEDTIYINAASKNVKAQIVAHELTHSIERAGTYQSLVNLTMDKLEAEQKAKGKTLADLYRAKEMQYAKGGVKLASYDEITSELVAEFVEKRLLTDADSIKSLVSENRTLGQRIREWFDSLLAKMDERRAAKGDTDAQARVANREFIVKMRDLYAEALGESMAAESVQEGGTKYSFAGVNDNGIEVYETSSETMKLNWNERKKKYLDLMRDEYQGRTAKFVRNGHVYYAQYDPKSLRKPIYGDKRSSPNGVRALVKAGADGDFFDLVENAKYTGSAANIKDHTNADYFDYYVKTVQIDGKMFDLMADVEKNYSADGGYVYTLALVDNEKIKASPAHGTPTVPVNNAGNASVDSISQDGENVKRKFSVSEEKQTDDPLAGVSSAVETEVEEIEIESTYDRLLKKKQNAEGELSQNKQKKNEMSEQKGKLIEKLQGEYDRMRRKDTKAANDLLRRIEREKRLKADIDADYAKRISDNEKRIARLDGEMKKDHTRADRLEREYAKIDRQIERGKAAVRQEFAARRADALGNAKTRAEYTKRRALQMYRELNSLKKGVRASAWLSELLDVGKQQGYDWNELKEGLLRASRSGKRSGEGAEAIVRQEDEIAADLEQRKQDLVEEYDERRSILESQVQNHQAYISNRAFQLYSELNKLEKGTKASEQLSMLLDYTKEQNVKWNEIKSALLVINRWTDEIVNPESKAEVMARQYLEWEYMERSRELENIDVEFQREIESLEQIAEAQRSIVHIDEKRVERMQAIEDMVRNQLIREYDYQKHRDDPELEKRLADLDTEAERLKQEAKERDQKETRKDLHQKIVNSIKETFSARGLDLDKALYGAKDLSTFSTVDNTPQRVMERSLGYKAGQVLSDLTVNQTAKNETEGIRWLNQFTDRKEGVLAQLSKKYNIKPGSKESAAAQMYAEGFYVDKHNEIVEYGDRELAADFPDAQVQKNIKGLAHDPIIRQIYDQTLDAINESRVRNAYPEIQKLDNYYLHFRAMDDTFSKLGIPFNPNDIRAKDLPTDINGVTADLKPGQPYFSSAQHRTGKRTSFDLLGGLEKYLTSAKNQIYHIDDIQTLRALRNYIADMYGQANGLEGLDALDEEAVQERIQQVNDSHLSTFAKFLNEEANVLAGKTSLIDRGLEGIIGRRGITFLNDVNRQVGANMVGWNISSSLTNFLAPVQAFAKTNKTAFIKGFAQTVSNRLKSITGNSDGFAETSDVMVRRRGADRFHRTAWQKLSDPGYLLMGMVDDISTEIIARAKYNELTAKGMDAQTANRETDKWVSRLMGDRSLGQMPQIFNSKMLGLVTKFQLEVRNQLDSQFYDTIKEAQADYEEIGDKTKRNAKVAAKVAATFVELALTQHVFGQVFESIAGYNPAFDIIEVIATVLGLDDDEESEDTVLDNIEQGVLALIEDMPYSSVIMDGGRVPMSAALPISELVTGEDQYGNGDDRYGGAIQRAKTLAGALPYYVLPGGYGQIKKTAQGLAMFGGDKPVTGSYTDSGNLRFPVEATPGNIAQAAVFGQWASENARDYFDNERSPISEKQAQEFADSGMEWDAYRKYRTDIAKLSTLQEKADYISKMQVPVETKNLLVNNIANRKTPIDMEGYDEYTLKGTREKDSYLSMIEAGVSDENAVKAVEAVSGVTRTIDKINAIWSTGIKGAQLDSAVKAVVTEKWYERYRAVIDANVPLDVLTWVLDNADTDENDSISNEERTLILSQLAMSREELSALWIASGGSEKSNPWGSGGTSSSKVSIKTPTVKMPENKMPEINFNVPRFDFEFGGR